MIGLALLLVGRLPPPSPAWQAVAADRLAPAAIARIVREAARSALRGELPGGPSSYPASLHGGGGTFVTAVDRHGVRGCWGTLEASQPDLAHEIAAATRGAMLADRRHRPPQSADLGNLRFLVSIVAPLEACRRLDLDDPLRYGLVVDDGARRGVLLPGEARTIAWQVAECRRKAGIARHGGLSYHRFRTWVCEVGP